jgi:hypothetical protein
LISRPSDKPSNDFSQIKSNVRALSAMYAGRQTDQNAIEFLKLHWRMDRFETKIDPVLNLNRMIDRFETKIHPSSSLNLRQMIDRFQMDIDRVSESASDDR